MRYIKMSGRKLVYLSYVAGLFMTSMPSLADTYSLQDGYKAVVNGESAEIINHKGERELIGINTTTGSVQTWNPQDMERISNIIKTNPEFRGLSREQYLTAVQAGTDTISYPVDSPVLKLDMLKSGKVTKEDIMSVINLRNRVAQKINYGNASEYVSAVRNGGNSDVYLSLVDNPQQATEYSRIVREMNKLNKETEVLQQQSKSKPSAQDDGLRQNLATVKRAVTALESETAVYDNGDHYTKDNDSGNRIPVNDAVVNLDNRTRKNSQAIASGARTLREHEARLNAQQRQISENHKEMKRALAQSAALTGLFQPYSVGKFNASAAVGGYSDQQALAVGVGYRFNEKTAAKGGIAFSDGDTSWNMGVNVEF
ncbi:YadA-like family protein [Escherichia coli]|nr:YadA-like family protein [Escherichia coli]